MGPRSDHLYILSTDSASPGEILAATWWHSEWHSHSWVSVTETLISEDWYHWRSDTERDTVTHGPLASQHTDILIFVWCDKHVTIFQKNPLFLSNLTDLFGPYGSWSVAFRILSLSHISEKSNCSFKRQESTYSSSTYVNMRVNFKLSYIIVLIVFLRLSKIQIYMVNNYKHAYSIIEIACTRYLFYMKFLLCKNWFMILPNIIEA